MAFMNKRSLISLLVSIVLVLSIFTVGVFADETTDAVSSDVTTEAVVDSTEETTDAVSEETTATATTEEATTKKEETTTKATSSTTTTGDDHDHGFDWTELIVNLVIGGIIIIVGAILIIKNRVKLAAFLRSVKSETKKIVWSPKDQTRKNFLVVVIICVAVVILVGILDFAFGYAIAGLAKLFK